MTRSTHVNALIAKASKRLAVIKRYRKILPRTALTTLYIAMVRPILEYGDVLYYNSPLSIGRSIEQVQRRAALACTGGYRHTSYKNLLHELNWEPLYTRRKNHKLIIFYKITNNIYPKYLHDLLIKNTHQTYQLRHTHHFRPRQSRLTTSHNSFFPSTTRLWNNLPNLTKISPTVNLFKTRLRGQNNNNPYHNTSPQWLTQIRMGLSALNAQRFKYNFIPSPTCPSCYLAAETPQHYFFHCPTHRLARETLLQRLQGELDVNTQNFNILLSVILEGESIRVQQINTLQTIVLEFLKNSNRFN